MNVACPECRTVYRIDPGRVPEGGVTTRCRECGTGFRVPAGQADGPGVVVAGHPAPAESGSTADPTTASARPVRTRRAEAGGGAGTPVFGPQDPETRARRLARALVSDVKVYNPEKWQRSRAAGTLRADFRDEILKSWGEYVEQVGEPMAKGTPYFREALNDILAGGEGVF